MRECWECGEPRKNKAKCETCGAREFQPCVAEMDGHTEMLLADDFTVWTEWNTRSVSLGYDADGKLIGIRVWGKAAARPAQ